jgi:hypothetical protein
MRVLKIASLSLCSRSGLVAAARRSCSAKLASAKNPRSIEGLLAELEACAQVALFPAQESLRLRRDLTCITTGTACHRHNWTPPVIRRALYPPPRRFLSLILLMLRVWLPLWAFEGSLMIICVINRNDQSVACVRHPGRPHQLPPSIQMVY